MTPYHWDLPQALEDDGGWPRSRHGRALRRVRGDMLDAHGDRVKWCAINEPWIIGLLGYLHGLHAPGTWRRLRRGDRLPSPLAHGRAVQEQHFPGRRPRRRRLLPRAALSGERRDADWEVAKCSPTATSTAGSSILLVGLYPNDMRDLEERIGALDFVHDGDLATIATPSDFIAVPARGAVRGPR